jgi:hypothetical protein
MFEQSDKCAATHGADSHDAFWPEIPDFQNPRSALHARDDEAGEPAEELRRGRDDNIGRRQTPYLCRDRDEKGEVIEDAMKEAFVWCEKSPNPDDFNAVHILLLKQSIAIRRLQLAIRMIGGASDYGDLVSRASPFLCELANAASWRVHLGGIVVCEKKDAHRADADGYSTGLGDIETLVATSVSFKYHYWLAAQWDGSAARKCYRQRLHSAIGYITPDEAERQAA